MLLTYIGCNQGGQDPIIFFRKKKMKRKEVSALASDFQIQI